MRGHRAGQVLTQTLAPSSGPGRWPCSDKLVVTADALRQWQDHHPNRERELDEARWPDRPEIRPVYVLLRERHRLRNGRCGQGRHSLRAFFSHQGLGHGTGWVCYVYGIFKRPATFTSRGVPRLDLHGSIPVAQQAIPANGPAFSLRRDASPSKRSCCEDEDAVGRGCTFFGNGHTVLKRTTARALASASATGAHPR